MRRASWFLGSLPASLAAEPDAARPGHSPQGGPFSSSGGPDDERSDAPPTPERTDRGVGGARFLQRPSKRMCHTAAELMRRPTRTPPRPSTSTGRATQVRYPGVRARPKRRRSWRRHRRSRPTPPPFVPCTCLGGPGDRYNRYPARARPKRCRRTSAPPPTTSGALRSVRVSVGGLLALAENLVAVHRQHQRPEHLVPARRRIEAERVVGTTQRIPEMPRP